MVVVLVKIPQKHMHKTPPGSLWVCKCCAVGISSKCQICYIGMAGIISAHVMMKKLGLQDVQKSWQKYTILEHDLSTKWLGKNTTGEIQRMSFCPVHQETTQRTVWPSQLSPHHYEYEQQIHQLLLHLFILWKGYPTLSRPKTNQNSHILPKQVKKPAGLMIVHFVHLSWVQQ